ncbi:MAG: winged helix-turn-helix transcriptional regulator [Romboutsia sp.]|nr:winged helix-turn-helix transcriptional regulator [Romboutsia sp.]
MYDSFIKLNSIVKDMKRKNREIISSYKLSPNEIDILVFLDLQDKYDTASDIVEAFEISKSLVCRSVDSLIKRNYIDTIKDEKDKRITHLKLRDEAKPIVDTLKSNRQKIIKDLTKDISDDDIKIFNSVLDKMRFNLSKEDNQ